MVLYDGGVMLLKLIWGGGGAVADLGGGVFRGFNTPP